MDQSGPCRRPGFSLVELLVVIAVVSVLVGVLLPGLAGARAGARATACAVKMRTLGQLTDAYADDHRDLMPLSQHSAFTRGRAPWGYAFFEQVAGSGYTPGHAAWRSVFDGFYRCPADPRRGRWSYGFNVYYELTADETGGRTWDKRTLAPLPHASVVFGELSDLTSADHAMAHFWIQQDAPPEIDARRHGGRTGVVFLDGHARTVEFTSVFSLQRSIDCFNPATAR